MNTDAHSFEGRTGATTRARVPAAVLAALNAGEIESVNLVEILSIDFRALLPAIGVPLADTERSRFAMDAPFTRRVREAGELAYDRLGPWAERDPDGGAFAALSAHRSDTARGVACYALCAQPGINVRERLDLLRPFAADSNQSVREWAWLAVRQQIIDELHDALGHLIPWVFDTDANVRRFASEATRPRGVWCPHIRALRDDPARALPLLEPIRADPSRYVQNSVANWLNDASKDQPGWVRSVCERWTAEVNAAGDEAKAKACSYTVKRALRTLRKRSG